MYGVPPDEMWSFLVGRKLTQLCVGEFDLQLRFDDETSICVNVDSERPSFCHVVEMRPRTEGAFPANAASLLSLVGARVRAAMSLDPMTLSLTFENREQLRLFDASSSFESFTIWTNGRAIVV